MKQDGSSKYDPVNSPTSVGYTKANRIRLATSDTPFKLESGESLDEVWVEYECYGTLNASKTNAILIAHALSGDAHAAGWSSDYKELNRPWNKNKPGWWDSVVGPSKALDTGKYFIICSNVLGSCFGTTGPNSINVTTGKTWGLDFPLVTIGDWVALQARLIDHLGIEKLYGVVGGSLGGQQVLEWVLAYPDRVLNAAVLATASRLSAQGVAFNAVGRHSILNDPNFNSGNYYDGVHPDSGLAAARMLAHITYLSQQAMDKKFGRRLQDKESLNYDFGIEFEVESYLNHQGKSFVKRFDANSYLYITKAMDYYDAAKKWGNGDLKEALKRVKARVCIVTFSSDWLYSPKEAKELANALVSIGKEVSFIWVDSDAGHDAFLIETKKVSEILKNFFDKSL